MSVSLFPSRLKVPDTVLRVNGNQVCSRGRVCLFYLQDAPEDPVLSPWEPRTRCLWPQRSQRRSMPSSKGLIPTSRYTSTVWACPSLFAVQFPFTGFFSFLILCFLVMSLFSVTSLVMSPSLHLGVGLCFALVMC